MSIFDEGYDSNTETPEVVSSSTDFLYGGGGQGSDGGWEWNPMERMEASLQQSFGSLWAAGGAVADVVGADKASEWAMNRSATMFEKAAEKDLVNTDFSEISNPLDAGKYAVELITNFIPDIAMMALGGAGLGTASARAVGKGWGAKTAETMLHKGFTKNLKEISATQAGKEMTKDALYKKAITATVRDAGALVGVAGIEGAQGAGQAFTLDKELRGDDASGTAALATGAAQSMISMFNPLNKVLAGKFPNGKASILKMTGGEAAEEMGQEIPAMMHEAGIDPNKTFGEIIGSEEGAMRLIESGVAGALLGGTFGGAVRMVQPKTAKETLEESGIDTSGDTVMPSGDILEKDVPANNADSVQPQWQSPDALRRADAADTMRETEGTYDPELPTREQPDTLTEGEVVTEPELPVAPVAEEAPVVPEMDMGVESVVEEGVPYRGPWQSEDKYIEFREEAAKQPKVTKLSDKKKVADAKKVLDKVRETGEVPTDIKVFKDETFDEVPQDTNIDPTNDEATIARAKDLEAKSEAANSKILATAEAKKKLKGWTNKNYDVDGKTVATYEKDNSKIVKHGKESWQLVNDENGTMDDRGMFKSLSHARDAQEKGTLAEDYYQNSVTKKQARKAQPLSQLQGEMLTSLSESKEGSAPSFEKFIGQVQSKTGTQNDSEVVEVITEAMIDSAKTYKPSKKATFRSYAMGNALGAVKDLNKTRGKVEVQDVVREDGEGSTTGKVESATKADMETVYVAPKKKAVKKEAPPVKVVEATDAEKAAILKRFQEQQAKAGAPVPKKKEVKPTNLKERNKVIKEEKVTPKPIKETKPVVLKKSDKLETDYESSADVSFNGDTQPTTITVDRVGTKSDGYWRFSVTSNTTSAEVTGSAETLKQVRGAINDIVKLGTAEEEYGRAVPKKQRDAVNAMREESQALTEAEEDVADGIATDYSIGSKSALASLEKFDNDYTGKLTEIQQEARQLLVDGVAIDAEVGERFNKKYPDGLALLERSVNAIDAETGALARFLLTNPAIRKKLRDVKVIKAMQGSSRYNPEHNTVYMKTENSNTAVHELVHAVTVNEMSSNSEVKNEVEGMMDVVKFRLKAAGVFTDKEIALLESAKTSDGFKEGKKDWGDRQGMAYALINPNEFLSQAFSSKSFQEFLKEIKVESPKTKRSYSLWKNLIDIVGKLMGVSKRHYSMLEKIITYVPEIAEVGITKKAKGVSEAPSKTRAEQVAIMKKNDLRGKPKDQLTEWMGRAADTIRDVGKGVTERLRKIDHTLIRPVREMEFNILRDNKKYQLGIKDFSDKYRKMSKEDRLMLDLVLMNREEADIKERNAILRRNGMTASYKKVEEVLAKIHKEKGKVGLNQYKDKANYFPRRVKDVRALMQTIKDDPNYNIIQAQLDSMGEDATDAEKEKAITGMINTGRFPAMALMNPSSSKRRTIERVSSEWKHHYDNSQDALVNHIYESNEAIHARKLLGDTHRKDLVGKRDSLYKELEGKEVKGKARKRKIAQVQSLEEQLSDYDTEISEGIDSMLRKKAPNLTTSEADTVVRLIRARLTQKGMHGPLSTVRNISLMSVLSSPTSAITQIGDLAFSIYQYGPEHTVKAILGKKMIVPEDLDLAHSMKEFQSEGTAKWLDKTLKWSGLSMMDSFGKTTTMNAAISKAKSMTLKEFTEKYSEFYGEDTSQLHRDLVGDRKTELTQFFAFNELSEVQPVSMSEMPLTYLQAGNGRIFFALKSYNIKALNTIYRESVHKWRTAKTPEGKGKAMRDVGKLVLLMSFAGATADELKDFLLGKDAGTFSDSVQDNLLKIAFLSRYTLDQGFSKGIVKTLSKDILLPPTPFIDDPISDMVKFLEGEPDLKTLNSLPWGKVPYSWLSGVEEGKDMGNLRKEIMEDYKEGGSFGSIRKKMNKYNAWVRSTKDKDNKPITMSTLTRARRTYLKEQRS